MSDHNAFVQAKRYARDNQTEEARRYLARAAGRYFQHYGYADEYSQN